MQRLVLRAEYLVPRVPPSDLVVAPQADELLYVFPADVLAAS